MIGYPKRLLIDHVLAPQGDEARGELRAVLNPNEVELGVEVQNLDLMPVSTRPLQAEIGGGMSVRHELSVRVEVQHGDLTECERLRDGIVLELVTRFMGAWSAMVNDDEDSGGQSLSGSTWRVDYRALRVATPAENATVVFTLDADVPG